MLLPWEYSVRNLSRRPVRTGLTLMALSIVILLVFVVVGFIRGLERSLRVTGDPEVVLISSINSEANLESSAIPARTPTLVAASIDGTQSRYGVICASPEMYLGTRVTVNDHEPAPGLIRAVTTTAPLVRRSVRIEEGHWPDRGEVLVGRLASAKLGMTDQAVDIGQSLTFEGQTWKISGRFSADGAAYESEIWCNLEDFQSATKRQDLSLVALLLKPGASPGEVSLFCKERMDLELRAVREIDFYAELQQHYSMRCSIPKKNFCDRSVERLDANSLGRTHLELVQWFGQHQTRRPNFRKSAGVTTWSSTVDVSIPPNTTRASG